MVPAHSGHNEPSSFDESTTLQFGKLYDVLTSSSRIIKDCVWKNALRCEVIRKLCWKEKNKILFDGTWVEVEDKHFIDFKYLKTIMDVWKWKFAKVSKNILNTFDRHMLLHIFLLIYSKMMISQNIFCDSKILWRSFHFLRHFINKKFQKIFSRFLNYNFGYFFFA